MSKITYEIDEAMMGSEWKWGTEGLVEFANILQEFVGDEFEIKPITWAYNGADNGEYANVIDDETWNDALEKFLEH